MDSFWIISVLIMSNEQVYRVRGTDYYCTQKDTWITTMKTCLEAGGEPISTNDVVKAADFSLKPKIAVWTKDYIDLELVTSIPSEEEGVNYNCGFRTLQKNPDYVDVYTPLKLQYANCSERKNYFCKEDSSTDLKSGRSTWLGAYQACDYPFKLWEGFSVRSYNNYHRVDAWVLAARRYSSNIVTDSSTINGKTIIACGTSKTKISRDDPNNCEDKLQAVCSFVNNTMVPVNFTKSCIEEQEETTVQETTTEYKEERSQPVTVYQNNTVTIKTAQGNPEMSRTIVIIAISVSVVFCCVFIGLIIIILGRRSRRRRFEKQPIVENFRQTFSTANDCGINSYTNSNEVGKTNNIDSDYYNIYTNKTPEGDHDDVYTFPNNETKHRDVYSIPSTVIPPNNQTKDEMVLESESEYDTTNAVKAFSESANIYNKLGCNNVDSVYDNNDNSVSRNPLLSIDNTYSTARADDTYNTLHADLNRNISNPKPYLGENVYGNAHFTNKDYVCCDGDISRGEPNRNSIEMTAYSTVHFRS